MLLIITLLAGCNTNEIGQADTISDMLTSPYTAQCRARVVSDKTDNEYEYTCTRLPDGTYNITYGDMTVSVSDSGGTITAHGINVDFAPMPSDMVMIPTYFFNTYMEGGTLTDSDRGYTMECDIPGDNPYRDTAVMLLDDRHTPLEMHIRGATGKDTVVVKIEKFTKEAG